MLVIRQKQLDALGVARRETLIADLVQNVRRKDPMLRDADRDALFGVASRALDLALTHGFIVLDHQLRFAELLLAAGETALELPGASAILADESSSGAARLDRMEALVKEQ
ncbi:MAG TPA: hypothetical protein VGQ36_12430 [Thermoanaerobaculia bacterium]|jgi:hypothetical protein|nr:hypothetical protein [Thermoanaerobaculia bacterium]